ncbi:ATP-binding protein [Cerasicoccus maritimus]|uniref:ATP-binding protein n=1 Tax=Cerasicoccus maritimus TaxID=490089 RepID=UPI002852C447|nr:ATP-binding protein [Cerasicoccus maritimus]
MLAKRNVINRRVPCPVSICIALLVALTAILVIGGWVFESAKIVQILPKLAPMQATTAFGFLLFAGGLFALSAPGWIYKWRLDFWFGLALFVWGAANLSQHAFGINLGVDHLFGEPFLVDNSPAPGRMSMLTSMCFFFGGVAMLLSQLAVRSVKIEVLIVLIACLVAGISGSALFCYIIEIPRIVWLGARFSEMALHTSSAFFLLSMGLIMQRFRCGRALYQEAFRWMWAPTFFGTTFAVGSVFLGFHAQYEQTRLDHAQHRAEFLADLIDAHYKQFCLALIRMADRVEYGPASNQPEWLQDAHNYTTDFRSIKFLHVRDTGRDISWQYPLEPDLPYAEWLSESIINLNAGDGNYVAKAPPGAPNDFLFFRVHSSSAVESPNDSAVLYGIANYVEFIHDAIHVLGGNSAQEFLYNVRLITTNNKQPPPARAETAYSQVTPELYYEIYVDPSWVEVDRLIANLFLIGGIIVAVVLSFLVYLIYLNRRRYQELDEAQAMILRQKSRLESYVHNAPASVAMFDRRMRYVAVSNQWKLDYGLALDAKLVGRSHYEVFPDMSEEWKAIHRECMQGKVRASDRDCWRPPGWDHDQYLRWEIRPWSDVDDSIGGIIMFTADITQIVQRERELERLRNEAETANRAKTNFLANMSHEIRTPMNAILGFAELLSKELVDVRQSQFIRSIRSSGKTLLGLINDLLDLAKIEAGKIELSPKPVSFSRMFRELQDVFQLQADMKGVTLEHRFQNGLPSYLLLDDFRLQQVLLNLLSNAIKFTDEGSVRLVLEYAEHDGNYDLTFTVSDTGRGIPESFRERAFNKFEQAEEAAKGGTGLGLAISAKLVALMGGKIDYSSELGKGTSFFFTIPNVQTAEPVLDRTIEDHEDSLSMVFPEAKVLIVEDTQANMDLMLATFASVPKLTIIEAECGEKGLEMAVKHRPDLILLDISMPDLDGRDVCQRLRRQAAFADTPILAITASLQQSELDLEKRGFNECLIKPIPPHVLLKACHHWLNGSMVSQTSKPNPDLPEPMGGGEVVLPVELQGNLLRELKRHDGGFSIDALKAYAGQLNEAAQEYQSAYLSELSHQLMMSAETFDVATVRQTLGQLKTFLLSMHSNETV